jgi:phosphopantothenoylcysteine decarboxylase/phosphopantothenate--cysteine ligase
MNTAMWENPLTQANLKALLADPRYRQVGPTVGMLAEQTSGMGRLAEPPDIVEAAEGILSPKDLAGLQVLVTAGRRASTWTGALHLQPLHREDGYAGRAPPPSAAPRSRWSPDPARSPRRRTSAGLRDLAEEMAAEVLSRVGAAHLVVAAAAVADQRPEHRAAQKVKKQEG